MRAYSQETGGGEGWGKRKQGVAVADGVGYFVLPAVGGQAGVGKRMVGKKKKEEDEGVRSRRGGGIKRAASYGKHRLHIPSKW